MTYSDAPFAASKTALLNTLQSIRAPQMGIRARPEDHLALKTYWSEILAMVEETAKRDLAEAKSRAVYQPDMCGLEDGFLIEAASGMDGLFEQLSALANGEDDLRPFSLRVGRAA